MSRGKSRRQELHGAWSVVYIMAAVGCMAARCIGGAWRSCPFGAFDRFNLPFSINTDRRPFAPLCLLVFIIALYTQRTRYTWITAIIHPTFHHA
jgi:hypothetical protein